MKFLIQKIDGQIRHDFSFQLLESIRYFKWLNNEKVILKYYNSVSNRPIKDQCNKTNKFKSYYKNYVPIGSVEFVEAYFEYFYKIVPKPINVPDELFSFAQRDIFNGDASGIYNCVNEWFIKNNGSKWFVKSNDTIKSFSKIINVEKDECIIPEGNYQYSHFISIDSEWRAFVYKGKLIGLQNYCGEFTKFPDVREIKKMIAAYKSAPIAYTLDIGINDEGTFVIEVHNFYSCGLYGFKEPVLARMFWNWFVEYVKENCNISIK